MIFQGQLVARNAVWNTAGNLYVALITLASTSLYLEGLGTHSYAVVAFYLNLQVLLFVLDAGLSPAIIREVSLGENDPKHRQILAGFLKFSRCAYALIFALALFTIYLSLNFIIPEVFNSGSDYSQPSSLVFFSLFIAISIRICGGYFRYVMAGRQQFARINAILCSSATARLILPLYFQSNPDFFEIFAIIQVVAALIETVIMFFCTLEFHRGLPIQSVILSEIKGPILFAGGTAITAIVGALSTHYDRVITAYYATSSNSYASYAAAAYMAALISMIFRPSMQAILPMLAGQYSKTKNVDALLFLKRSYYSIFLGLMVLFSPVAMVFILLPEAILSLWTHDVELVADAAIFLKAFAVGFYFISIAAIPYVLLFTLGRIRTHVYFTIGYITLYIPILHIALSTGNLLLVAYIWAGANAVLCMLYVPSVHKIVFQSPFLFFKTRLACLLFFQIMLILLAFVFPVDEVSFLGVAPAVQAVICVIVVFSGNCLIALSGPGRISELREGLARGGLLRPNVTTKR